jgi:hypothetical protein
VIPVVFAIDATIGRSRPSSPRRDAAGADIRTLIDRTPLVHRPCNRPKITLFEKLRQ